jgi:hypothetical protein
MDKFWVLRLQFNYGLGPDLDKYKYDNAGDIIDAKAAIGTIIDEKFNLLYMDLQATTASTALQLEIATYSHMKNWRPMEVKEYASKTPSGKSYYSKGSTSYSLTFDYAKIENSLSNFDSGTNKIIDEFTTSLETIFNDSFLSEEGIKENLEPKISYTLKESQFDEGVNEYSDPLFEGGGWSIVYDLNMGTASKKDDAPTNPDIPFTAKYISTQASSNVPVQITFDIFKNGTLFKNVKETSVFQFDEPGKMLSFLAKDYFYDANGKWLTSVGDKSIPPETKIEIAGYPFPPAVDPAGMSASGVDNGNPTELPDKNPVYVSGNFTLKVKSGPGVIIGITEVEIVSGKADFSGIQFDQPGDYVVTVGSTSPDVSSTDIMFKVLPEPSVIPQESKGSTESNASGTRPIIAQIDRPTIEVKPMEFERQGTDKGGTVQVATTIGLTPFLSYNGSQINDRDIVSFSLYHEGMIPKVDIIFRDSNGMISQEPPRDNTTFEIFLNSRSVNLKSIHLIFKIEEFGRLQGGQYSIAGSLDVSNLYRNKFKVRRGTSFEVLREICKDLKIGFNSNIESTDDNMPWRNVGDKEYKFMEDIIKHSYISEESFMAGYIDFYYCFNYVDIEKEMKRDISKDVGIDTGGIDKPNEKDLDKIKPLKLTSEKGEQSSNGFFVKKAERSEATKISMEQGYRTRTKFYDTVKKMFLVFDVDSTTSDGAKSHILKGAESDKESFDNNYVTKYQGKIDTDNVHKNHNYAVTQNKINLDNMMKNQLDISLPNPNFNLYRFQKIQLFLVKDAVTVAAPESIEWRYSGEWMIASIKFTFLNGTLTQDITLARKEMGKNPAEIKEGTNNGVKETKDQKNENPIVGSASSTVLYKPNEKYKVGDVFTVQDSAGKKYVLTINKISENGVDVVTSLKDPTAVPNQALTSPDTISGVTQSTTPIAGTPSGASASGVTASVGKYTERITFQREHRGYDNNNGGIYQNAVTNITNNHYVVGSYSLGVNYKTQTEEEKIYKDDGLYIAIKKPRPNFKPDKEDKKLTERVWELFHLNDEGLDGFSTDVKRDVKRYEVIKSRIFDDNEFCGGGSFYYIDVNKNIWRKPEGYIKITNESGTDFAKNTPDVNNAYTGNGYMVGPEWEGTSKNSDGEPVLLTPVGRRNTIYYDLQSAPPGTYTIEVKYYVPVYLMNEQGYTIKNPQNDTKAARDPNLYGEGDGRLMDKDPKDSQYNVYEERTFKETFSIVEKSKKR